MNAPSPRGGPPAIWTAFAQQGRWKSWLLVGQLLVIGLLVLVVYGLATRAPDVIVVAEDGRGTYVDATTSTAALRSFLAEQRGKASDLTLRAFTERFVRLTAAINSTTVDESWAEALGLMVVPLAQKLEAEAKAQRLLETYRLAQVKTTLRFDKLELVERRADKAHVRAVVHRFKEKLAGGGASEDVLQVDLVLADVPRSARQPDGLVVLDWRSAPVVPSEPAAPAPAPSP